MGNDNDADRPFWPPSPFRPEPLTVILTGISRVPEAEPVSLLVADAMEAQTWDSFTLVERGALRVLLRGILAALDEYEELIGQ